MYRKTKIIVPNKLQDPVCNYPEGISKQTNHFAVQHEDETRVSPPLISLSKEKYHRFSKARIPEQHHCDDNI